MSRQIIASKKAACVPKRKRSVRELNFDADSGFCLRRRIDSILDKFPNPSEC